MEEVWLLRSDLAWCPSGVTTVHVQLEPFLVSVWARTPLLQVSIDTACSSALVGAHAAVQHLGRHGGAALSAGVNLMLAEHTTAATHIAGARACDSNRACVNVCSPAEQASLL